jgi:hypothetical protein
MKDRGPFRVDYQFEGSKTWVPDSTQLKALDKAEDWAREIAPLGSGVTGWRIVPADHPTREKVDYDASALAGFPTVKLSW